MSVSEKTNYWWDLQVCNRFGKYLEGYNKDIVDRAVKILSHVEEKRVLDYGCGSGTWSLYLHKYGFEVFGVDINEEALRIYQEKIPGSRSIRTIDSDTIIPLADESVDLVIVINLSQMFIHEWFVRESFRVLKPDGILVGSMQNRFSWRGILQSVKSILLKTDNPFRLSFGKFRSTINNTGFDLIYGRGFGWIPVPSRWNNSILIPLFKVAERFLFLGKFKTVSPNVAFVLKKRNLK